jgi:hypothetical protein
MPFGDLLALCSRSNNGLIGVRTHAFRICNNVYLLTRSVFKGFVEDKNKIGCCYADSQMLHTTQSLSLAIGIQTHKIIL